MNFPSLEWFLSTPFGAPYAELSNDLYVIALQLSESELSELRCWCPALYPTALQIKLSLILQSMVDSNTNELIPVQPEGGKIAYVIKDKVADTERQYELVDQESQIKQSTVASALENMIARCKAPFGVGATLVKSVGNGFGGCCAGLGLDNGALNDMGAVEITQVFAADKADG